MLRQMKLFRKKITRVGFPRFKAGSVVVLALMFGAGQAPARAGQKSEPLTPIQREIERQQVRLKSEDIEQRRDALMRLGGLKRPDASRAAAAGLTDIRHACNPVSAVGRSRDAFDSSLAGQTGVRPSRGR